MIPDEDRTYVSVLMPVYNGELYLAEAIESILCQTHPFFEFVIINDGSTDRTEQILDQYAKRDSRIRVYSQENLGQPAALNRGLRLAKCDWVAIIDHDDVSVSTRLEQQLKTISRFPDLRLLGTHGLRINAAGKRLQLDNRGPTTVAEFRDLQSQRGRVSLFHTSALMHRTTVLSLGGYDPAFGPCADSELWTRIAEHHLVLVVPEPLVLYRVHRGSMSFKQMSKQRELLEWCNARQAARYAGRPLPTLEQYQDECRSGSWLKRAVNLREKVSWYLRTRRRFASADGQYGTAAVLSIAIALVAPMRAIRAVYRFVT